MCPEDPDSTTRPRGLSGGVRPEIKQTRATTQGWQNRHQPSRRWPQELGAESAMGPGSSLFRVHSVTLDDGRGGQNVPLAWAQFSVALHSHASPARLGPARPSLDGGAQRLSQAGKQLSPFRLKATRLALAVPLFLTGSCK